MINMKRIFIGLVFCAVIAAFSFFFITRNTTTKSSEITREFTVAVISPNVFLKATSESAWITITDSVSIGVGAEIKTSASGRAKILYPNGTITTIEGDSDVVIAALAADGNKSRLSLIFGSIWSKIQNILGTNDYYEVDTGNIVASVRDSIFALEYRDSTSTVYGIGSTVNVAAKNPQGTTVFGTNTNVESGEKAVVSGTSIPIISGTPIPVSSITDAEINQGILTQNLIELGNEDSNNLNKELKKLLKRLRRNPGNGQPQASSSQTPTPTPAPTPN